eukprot:4334637-Prymnesium_polylepis.2
MYVILSHRGSHLRRTDSSTRGYGRTRKPPGAACVAMKRAHSAREAYARSCVASEARVAAALHACTT